MSCHKSALSAACDSSDISLRCDAGALVFRAVEPKTCLIRRVERIEWLGAFVFERNQSLHVDFQSVYAAPQCAKIEVDVLPVCLFPKAVFAEFDARARDGMPVRVASRSRRRACTKSRFTPTGGERRRAAWFASVPRPPGRTGSSCPPVWAVYSSNLRGLEEAGAGALLASIVSRIFASRSTLDSSFVCRA